MAYGNWHGAMWRNVWANSCYSIDVQWDYCQDIEANKTKISMMAIRIHRLNSAYYFYNAYGKVGLGDFSGNKFESTVSMDLRNASSQTFDLTDLHSECTHNADGSWPNGMLTISTMLTVRSGLVISVETNLNRPFRWIYETQVHRHSI